MGNKMQILSVIIPVYNEEKTINKVINSVEKTEVGIFNKEIIIIDDCSTDDTKNILKNLDQSRAKIIFNEKNMGKGYSVRRGFEEISGDFIIIQDADLEYNPEEYSKLLKPLISGFADVVYGSRFMEQKFIFKPYFLANKFLTFFSNIFTGLHLTDMETCYKCFTKGTLDKIRTHLKADKFEIEPEITAVVAKNKLRIMEVPISYRRRSYVGGKKIGWRDGLKAIWAIITT